MKFTEYQTALLPPKTRAWLFEKFSLAPDDKRRVIHLVKGSDTSKELESRTNAEHEANRILIKQ